MAKIITTKNVDVWSGYAERLRAMLYEFNSMQYSEEANLLIVSEYKDRLWDEVFEIERETGPKKEFWKNLKPGDHLQKDTYFKTFNDGRSSWENKIEYTHIIDFDDDNAQCETFTVTENSVYAGFFMEHTLSSKSMAFNVLAKKMIPVTKEEWDAQMNLMNTLKQNYNESRGNKD